VLSIDELSIDPRSQNGEELACFADTWPGRRYEFDGNEAVG
jgi:hypothetical protein